MKFGHFRLSQRERRAVSPSVFTATRFLVIIANRTLKQKHVSDFNIRVFAYFSFQSTEALNYRRKLKEPWYWIWTSPWLFNGEAVDSQHPPQCILGAVDDVLLLLVVQLLLDDVLTQVEHHLQGEAPQMRQTPSSTDNIPD